MRWYARPAAAGPEGFKLANQGASVMLRRQLLRLLSVWHRQLVTQHGDLYVLRVRGLAAADLAEYLAENKECQRAHHHEPILPARHRGWSGPCS
jgi:hypothetical protein